MELFTESAYNKLLDKHIGTKTKKQLSYYASSFFGGLVAFGILFLVNVLAARWLGPLEYGKYSLVVAVANIFAVLFIMDLDVSVAYYMSKTKDALLQKRRVVATATSYLIVLSIVLGILIWQRSFLENVLSLDLLMFYSALGLGVAISLKRFYEGVMRGGLLFKKQAGIRIGETLVVLLTFIVLTQLLNVVSYSSYIEAVTLGAVLAVLLYASVTCKYFHTKGVALNKTLAVWKYGRYGIINSFATLLVKHIDKVFLVGIIGFSQLGVYTAYYTVAILLAGKVVQLLINAYFPLTARKKSIKHLIKKLDIFCFIGFVPVVLGAVLLIRTLLYFFGPEYPVYWDWIALLAIYVGVHFFASLYSWAIAGDSQRGYKYQNIGIALGALAFIVTIAGGYLTFGITIPLIFSAFIIHRLIPGILSYYMAHRSI
jgi:O-antigen/teichoic acid export membrane protein